MQLSDKHFYEFGPFSLDATKRLLYRDGAPVPLTSKSFETLLAKFRNYDTGRLTLQEGYGDVVRASGVGR